MNSQGSSCLTCQHHLKHSISHWSPHHPCLTGEPWALTALGFLVTLSTLYTSLGVLMHLGDFKTSTDWDMTQKFVSLPRVVPLNTGCLNTGCLNTPAVCLCFKLRFSRQPPLWSSPFPQGSCLTPLSLIQVTTKFCCRHCRDIPRNQDSPGPSVSPPTCLILMAFSVLSASVLNPYSLTTALGS